MEIINDKEIKKQNINLNGKDVINHNDNDKNKENEDENYYYDDNRNAEELKFIIKSLEALANESRLRIFRMLVKAGHSGLTVTEMSKSLSMPMSTLSFHLAKLSQTDIILSVKKSRFIIYSINFKSVNKLIGYLTESCCNGNPEECFDDICKK
jgi:ArsR family transcriptional regulator